MFVKEFRGIDELGLTFWELMSFIKLICDFSKRLRILKSLQEGDFWIAPVFSVPDISNKWAKLAYDKLIKRAERRKYWLFTKNEKILITVPRRDFTTFINATLSLLPKDTMVQKQPEVEADGTTLHSIEAPASIIEEVLNSNDQLVI